MGKSNLGYLFLLILILTISLACNTTPLNKLLGANDEPGASAPLASQVPIATSQDKVATGATVPTVQQAQPGGFLKSDCSMSGIVFDPINVDYIVDDYYDGPTMTCSYSDEGAHGLNETVYIQIVAYKPEKLTEFFQNTKEAISGFVAQSLEWNAHPDLPADARDEINILRDDGDGYVFMIIKDANVQGCKLGTGHGIEIVNGKYLVKYDFSSCEGTSDAYLASLRYMQDITQNAIKRVEAATQP